MFIYNRKKDRAKKDDFFELYYSLGKKHTSFRLLTDVLRNKVVIKKNHKIGCNVHEQSHVYKSHCYQVWMIFLCTFV